MRTIDRLIGVLFGNGALRKHLVKRYQRQLDTFLNSNLKIEFAAPSGEPDLSIIIPVYNGAHHLLRCLQSLARSGEKNIEIILYDDCSQDRVGELVSRCNNVIFVRGRQNLGFIGAVTAASEFARGRHILLMNSDAMLQEGNLRAGIQLLDENPGWGMIGVRIKLATGKLQEAGCVIFNDGTTDGYLRGAPADDPRALFVREVDFSSGAFLFARGSAFRNEGGLSKAYSPCYYEETDLAMRFRRRGLKSIYIPEIIVEHFEFGSQSTPSARQAISERRSIFVQNWGELLSTREFGPSNSEQDRYALRRAAFPRAILVLSSTGGHGQADLLGRALSSYGFVCVYLIGGVFNPKTRERWRVGSGMQLLVGSLDQLQSHLLAMHTFYDAILAGDLKMLEKLKTLRHVSDCKLLSA